MNRIGIFFVSCLFFEFLCSSSLGWAETSFPQPKVVHSQRTTADKAFRKILISHPYGTAYPDFVQPGVELYDYHVAELDALARGGKDHPLIPSDLPPGTRFKKVFAYYGFGSEKLTDALLRAREAGVEIEIMTDLNRALKGQFLDQPISVDFKRAQILDNEMGHSLVRWLQNGFSLGGEGPNTILSQPLFDEDNVKRPPIFHLKESFTVAMLPDGTERVLYMTTGTANMNEDVPRFNRFHVVDEPNFIAHCYDHYKLMAQTFREGGTIKDIPLSPPLLLQFKDGSTIQVSYTDGKTNWNDLLVDLLSDAANDPQNVQLQDVVMSDFVFTYRPFLEALEKALLAHPEANVFAVADQKFLNPSQWGLWWPLEGMDAHRPFGPRAKQFDFKARMRNENGHWVDRIRLFGWMSVAPGEVLTQVDGIPNAIELWHDKTQMVKVRVNGRDKYVLSLGTFNLSGNRYNQEQHILVEVGAQSRLARATEESIRRVVEESPHRALPGPNVLLLEELSRFLAQGYNYINPAQVELLLEFISQGRFSEVRGQLISMGIGRNDLSLQLTDESVVSRVDRLIDVLSYIKKNYRDLNAYKKVVNIRSLPSLLQVFWNRNLSPWQIKFILGGFFWRLADSSLPREARDRLRDQHVEAVWGLLGLSSSFESPSDEEPSVRVPEKPKKGLQSFTLRFYGLDDTLIHLRTKVILFRRDNTSVEKRISTRQFAQMLPQLQKNEGDWLLLPNGPNGGSFRYFTEEGSRRRESLFITNVRNVLNNVEISPEEWMGPVMEEFIERAQDSEQAQQMVILTRRGHAPRDIHKGLMLIRRWVKEHRHIDIFLPPVKNIIPLGHPDFAMISDKTDHRPEEILAHHVIEQLARLNDDVERNPDHGRGRAVFTDDSSGTIGAWLSYVVAELKNKGPKRFRHIDISAVHISPPGKRVEYSILPSGDVLEEPWDPSREEAHEGLIGLTPEEVLAGQQRPSRPRGAFEYDCSELLRVKPWDAP